MIAILSDIHGNLEALHAVLADAQSMKADTIICLGDLVGYGPNPCECIELAMSWKIVLQGDFEHALVNVDTADQWVPALSRMLKRLRKKVERHPRGERMLTFLKNCPTYRNQNDALYVHGSPRDHLNEYVFPEHIHMNDQLSEIFDAFDQTCFCGHSHIPGVFTNDTGKWMHHEPDQIDYVFRIGDDKVLCNVGSVGQPRDGDPRACYVLFDENVVVFRRVDYDFETTRRKIQSGDDDDDLHGDRLPLGR